MATILTALQNDFLRAFFQLAQGFYLTGGTALSAFYLQHRFSVDLDLFTNDAATFPHAEALVKETSAKLGIAYVPVEITSFFKHFRVGPKEAPLTLHFAKDVPFRIKPPNRFGDVLVDALEDIAANKICAALGRTEIKDLIDLYFLDQAGYSIPKYFDAAQQKDGGLAYETLAFTLSQFEILEIPTFMIIPVAVEDLKQFLENTISWLIRQEPPPSQ
ncbi:MAG: nucleotidyl transferase AbiEii/AbiGii toxin family protein [candidate division KSB1 bacterium]